MFSKSLSFASSSYKMTSLSPINSLNCISIIWQARLISISSHSLKVRFSESCEMKSYKDSWLSLISYGTFLPVKSGGVLIPESIRGRSNSLNCVESRCLKACISSSFFEIRPYNYSIAWSTASFASNKASVCETSNSLIKVCLYSTIDAFVPSSQP